MYVLVEKVVLEPDEDAPRRIQIWGCFIRTKKEKSEDFTAAVRGYIYLNAERGDCARWKDAAGTGKVVPIGYCWEAGDWLKLPIHKPGDPPGEPDGAPSGEYLGHFTDFYGGGRFDEHPEVKRLLEFAKKSREGKEPAEKGERGGPAPGK
jgi:hypothetical protein